MKTALFLMIAFLIGGWLTPQGSTVAQPAESCPANVLLALARSAAVCAGTQRNEACFANGAVEAVFQPGAESSGFVQPGDRAPAAALLAVMTHVEPEWGVAALQLQASLTDAEQRTVTLLLFGETALTNTAPVTPELTLVATGLVYVRAAPQANAEIVRQLNVRDTLIATGRLAGDRWLRVLIPGTNQPGWVAPDSVTAQGDLNTLTVVTVETPFYRPFQTFTLTSGSGDALCTGAPESGLLLQTPSRATEVSFIVNGAALDAAGTAFMQAGPGALVVSVLDGSVEMLINDETVFIPAGARAMMPLGASGTVASGPLAVEPYEMAQVQFVPVNNLAYRFRLPEPLTPDEIAAQTEAHLAAQAPPEPQPTPAGPQRCVRTVRTATTLRAGPALFYEAVNEIAEGRRITPVLQATDANGRIWWQLANGNWIQAAAVETTGDCPAIPLTVYVPAPPTNSLSLETCEAGNGPIREGQTVTIDFTPPAFETYYDAQQALNIDRGRIEVNDRPLQVSATQPLPLDNDRYYRVFSARWSAQPGTYRIVGQRLSYRVICDVTVPVG